jgi:hypothetical protein
MCGTAIASCTVPQALAYSDDEYKNAKIIDD